MMRILLVSARSEELGPFQDYLAADPAVSLQLAASGADALRLVRSGSPHLVIIDHKLPDTRPLMLVTELLMIDAMTNTALVSSLTDEAFHEDCEGLGVMARLPVQPTAADAAMLLQTLIQLTGQDA
jgi:DNA-binding response OmpR family regulator